MNKIIIYFFLLPLALAILNVQAFLSTFTPVSESVVQLFAYLNVCLVIAGTFFILKKPIQLPGLVKNWLAFYLFYYAFAIMANAIHGTEPFRLLASFIPVCYFLGFAVLANTSKNLIAITKLMTFAFFLTSVVTIVFYYFNISLDYDGVYEYKLQRAGGVYGDANNSAVTAILSLIFIHFSYYPKNRLHYFIKILGITISLYAVFLTFSKTGFIVLFIVLLIILRKFFNIKKIIFTLLSITLLIYILSITLMESQSLSAIQQERLLSLFNLLTFQTDNIQYSGRDVLLQNLLNYIYENPILGNGIQFSNSIRGHNTILGIWADAGIFVFLLFIAVLISYFVKSVRPPRRTINYFCLSILVTLFLFMLTLQTIIVEEFLMVVFVIMAYYLEPRRTENKVLGPIEILEDN